MIYNNTFLFKTQKFNKNDLLLLIQAIYNYSMVSIQYEFTEKICLVLNILFAFFISRILLDY